MNKLQWMKLKRDFEEQRCILMIGPHLAPAKHGDKEIPLLGALSMYLADFLDEEKVGYDPAVRHDLSYTAQQFLKIEGARRVDLEDMARDFMLEHMKTVPDVYKQLAQLPFHLIINTNADSFIKQALIEEGKQPFSSYYNFQDKQPNTVDIEQVNTHRPLVYNLFGSLDQRESMVLTEEDQSDFTRNMVRQIPPIPEEILGQFDERKTYLFFGFNLENWQFRLMLKSLQLGEENTTISPSSSRYSLSNRTKAFYEECFSFKFIDKEEIDFLSELQKQLGLDQQSNPKVKRKVFLLNHPKDNDFRTELINNLAPLAQNEEIEIHYPQKFTAGTDEAKIIEAFNQSYLVLPLVSPDFLADPALSGAWLPRAATHCDGQKAFLHPILIRACDWSENENLRRHQAFPENGKPVSNNAWDTRDEAWFNIVQSIKKRL